MASKSVGLQQLGFRRLNMQDVLPGQAVIIQKGCAPLIASVQPQKCYCPDIFEYHNLDPRRMEEWLISGRYCYFAGSDTIIDGISVYSSRENMGYKLAARIVKVLTPSQLEDIDVVMPIPETSNTTAPFVAVRLNKPYRQGFVKNRYSSCRVKK
ncbi:MAG: hypothetical protein Q9164_003488 [Protoblastenia rupestris]